jgi:hypothetical protein
MKLHYVGGSLRYRLEVGGKKLLAYGLKRSGPQTSNGMRVCHNVIPRRQPRNLEFIKV